MMPVISVLLEVAPHIARGLASGQLERVGGVIREASSKQVVAWLREGGKIAEKDRATALPIFLFKSLLPEANLAQAGNTAQQVKALANLVESMGAVSNVFGILNIAATARSHHLITLRLQAIQNMLAFSTRVSLLNVTLSGFGLLIMIKRFADILALLDKIHEKAATAIAKHTTKIDLTSALECANVVTGAADGNYKETMAASLDFLLINTREHLLSEFQSVRNKDASIEDFKEAQELLTQAMHLDETRIRTFLEVGQNDLARSVMQERLDQYRKKTQNFIGKVLGRNYKRAVYFNEKVEDKDLRRYLLIEQWLRGEEDILWDIMLERRKEFWNNKIIQVLEPPGGISLPGAARPEASTQHLEALAQAEAAIENFQRFEGFALELKALSRLGISLDDWEALQNTANTIFVNETNKNLAEHDDYALLVDKDWLDKQPVA